VLGGAAAVSAGVLVALRAYSPSVSRVAGGDRYATSADLAGAFPPSPLPPAVLFVASGAGFADGLSAAPVAALDGTVVLLAPAVGGLPTSVHDVICALDPHMQVVLGGPSSVSDAAAEGLTQPCT